MPGIRIDVDTSRSVKGLADFRKSLKDTGADAKLSAWEIKQLEDRVKKNLEADKAARAADKYADSIRSMGKAAGLSAREMGDLERRLGSIRRETESTHAGSSSLSGGITTLAGAFGRFAPQILAVTGAYLSLSKAMETVSNFVNRGFDFNRTMETASLGIASILTATQDLVTTEGRRLQGVEKLNAAQAISRDLMKDIQIMGLQTTATTKDLVDGFQMILGPATQAGMSLDQTKKTLIGIVQAFGALGIPLEQLSAESRSLLDGDITMQDRLAKALTITKEMVLEWQKQGVYFDKLNEKLEAFRVAGDATAKTWTGLSSNLAESFDVIAGRSTEGLFEGAKTAVAEITGLLIDTKNLGLGQDIQNIASLIREMGDDFGSLLVSGTRALVENIKDLDRWLGENRGKVESIYEKFKSIGSQLLDIVGKVFSMGEALVQADVATGRMDLVFGVIKASITVINELVGYMEAAFWAVSTAVVAGLLGPLADVQNAIAAIGKTSIGSKLIDADTVAALEQYAARNNATVEGFEKRLADVASRYKNTPFPSVKAAYNPDQTTKTRDELFREEHSQAYKDNLKSGIELEKLQSQELAKQLSLMGQIKEANSAALSVEQRRADVTQRWTEQRTKAEGAMAFAQKTGNAKLMEEATAMKNLADSGAVKAFDDIAKSAAKAGSGAAKAAQQAENFLESLNDQIAAAEAALSGDTLQTKLAQVDKRWNEWERRVGGAKLSAEQAAEAMAQIDRARGLERQAVEAQALSDALKRVADIMGDIADASGSPDLKIKAGLMDVDAWYQQSRQAIDQATQDEAQRAELVAALDQGVALKRLEVTRDAYESMSSVSQKYWDAEAALIEARLGLVKESADDELAYKIFAAQEWDDFQRRKLESQANSPRSQGEAIQAVFALDSGSYKSAMGQLQDEWKTTADRMLSLSDDLSSGIAQGLGDALRGLASGDIKSFEDVWKSMLNRMSDAFITYLEDMMADWLKSGLSSLFEGGSSSTAGASGGGLLGGLGDIVGKLIGSASSLFQGGAASAAGGIAASATGTMGGMMGSSGLASLAGSISSGAGAAAGAAIGSAVLPVIGTIIGAGLGILGGLLSQQEEKKKEPEEVWSGRSYMYAGGAMSGFKYTQMDDGSHKLDAIDPFELEQERREFKKTARDFNKSLKSLEINFDPNWTRSFSFMAPPVSDELASAVQHVMMQAAGAHALGGLTNTVGLFAEGLENLIEVVARLGEAFSLVVPTFGVLGVDMKKMSASSDAVIMSYAALATGFNAGVALIGDAVAHQADSAEELSAQFIALGEAGKQTVDYFETYRKQLTNLALAQYSELLIDAVGGEDAFKSATTTFSEYAMGDKERAESSIKYYTTKFGEGRDDIDFMLPNFEIEWMGDSVDAFWKAYSSAMQQSMPPSMFTVWTDVAANVAGLEDALQALEDVKFSSWAWDEELKYRRQVVDEQKTGAEITRWSIQLEQELADARKNGATYAQQAALVETQIYEMQAKLNELLGQAKDESNDYGTALTDLQEAIFWQIEWTSKLASEALAASGAFKSFGESLRDTIDSINADALLPNLEYAKYRTQMSGLFKAAMSGTDADAQEAMGKLGDIATSLLDAASRALSYQEYDALKARTVSQLSRAAAFSERQAEYQGVAGDMYAAQGGLLERMLAESKAEAPDTAFIENANSLLSLMAGISDAAKAVADGGMSADAFKALTGQAESSIMQTDLLDRLLGGTLDMAGFSQSQAQLLLSSVDALAALSDYTGRDVDLSDQMRQQLEIIAAGVTPQDQWGSLVTTIQEGQAEYIEWLKTNIASRREEADRLYALQQVENEAADQMNTYFQAMAEYLEKQTNMETIAASIATLQSKAASYQNLAMTAMMTGGTVGMILAMQHLQSAASVAEQIAALSAQLSYWANLEVEIPALASGGIATAPTLAMIGEGGGPEVVAPLGDLMSPLHELRQEMAALRRENRELQKQIVENTARTRGDTKELLRQSEKQTTILLRQEAAA